MTTAQKFSAQPVETRPTPEAQAGGTTITTYYLDSRGLPREVTVVNRWKSGAYGEIEITTFTHWGAPATIKAPTGCDRGRRRSVGGDPGSVDVAAIDRQAVRRGAGLIDAEGNDPPRTQPDQRSVRCGQRLRFTAHLDASD
jgi:hypothetical protein